MPQAVQTARAADYGRIQSTNFGFAIAQSMAAVAVPLLAVQAGHDARIVGVIVALAAVAQTLARLGMGRMMSRIPTKYFVAAAAVLLALSCGLLAFSTALWAFIVAQLLQGAARAYFWTGAQTHVVRASESSVSALARLNVLQGVGQLIGPAVAGILGGLSLQMSFASAAGVAAVALIPSLLLTRFDPFAKKKSRSSGRERFIWLRPGVRTAANMTAAAGAWRGILNSYLPLVLATAGYSVPMIGIIMTAVNLAALVGSALSERLQRRSEMLSSVGGILTTGLGLALACFFPTPLALVLPALFVSGLGAGILQTVGPALAADSVEPDEQGQALASIGIFRSVSLLASPLAVSGLILILPGAALASGVAGILMSTTALSAARARRSVPGAPKEGTDDDHNG